MSIIFLTENFDEVFQNVKFYKITGKPIYKDKGKTKENLVFKIFLCLSSSCGMIRIFVFFKLAACLSTLSVPISLPV